MQSATPSPLEWQRLSTLREYAILDTGAEPVFDDLAMLAARGCDTPVAAIAFVDAQRVWFKSRIGLTVPESPRASAFCAQTILQTDLLIVADVTDDARFHGSPAAAGDPAIRFYAGAPLIAPTGEALGVLCVMDVVPRALTPAQQRELRVLGRQVMAQLELRRRTAELAAQGQLLRTIFDSEPQCVKVLNLDGTVRLMNRAGLEILEAHSFDEIAGRHVLAFVAPAHRVAFQELLERVSRGEEGSLAFQTAGLRAGHRWLETHAVPLRDEHGDIVAILGITRDITEQKRAGEALRESERKFRTLFEQATDGIFLTDMRGRILDVNAAACQISGYKHDELVRMGIGDLIAPNELPRLGAEIRRLATGHTLSTEWQVEHRNGTPYTVEVTAKQLPDGRIQAFVRDVTDRKLAEAALRESESRLRKAVVAGRVGLWDWDLETGKVYYSSEWKRQIGYHDDEISDDFDEWLNRVHPDEAGAILERVRAFAAGDTADFEVEFRLRHKDGSYRQILTQGSKVFDETGHAIRVLGSHVDVTERNELHAQFLQAQKMESVGRLAGGIAHDFNNLLTVINGMAELAIASVGEHDPIRPELNEIRLAGDRAARLTRQLLALSRQQILRPEVINLSAVVSQMQSMFQRLLGEDVRLVLAMASDLDSVKADPGQIEQVILNLAINARDAMPDGGILTIETRNVELDAAFASSHPSVMPGPHVMLSVTDTGVGMDEATRKRAFEPFFTTKEAGKGTGLGLSTVYGIVKQTGGTVWVSSEPGAGTTFAIYLPRVCDVPRGVRAPASPSVAAAGTETVLLVEDERPLRDLTRRILQSAGYTILEAGSGEEALTLMNEHNDAVHLIVTDVVMPGMNGRELATRAAGARPHVKVLFMSGYTDDAILRHGVLDDTTRFITKPFTPAELKGKVREVLDA